MELPRANQSFLLRMFREFYREVARLRRVVEFSDYAPLAMAAAQTNGGTMEAPAAVPVAASSGIWQELLARLERQALEAGQMGGAFAFEIYREAQYVMAALADEVFLHVNWEGRKSWPLLEARLFQSQIAGEAVFQRLDRLLQRRDPFYLDLAAVYFMALSLGFQGKYRDSHNLEPLMQYRRQLFAMLYRRNPKLFSGSDALFPQAHENTLAQGDAKKLADQRVWFALVGVVMIFWLVFSHAGWNSLSGDIECMICKVMDEHCSCEVAGQ